MKNEDQSSMLRLAGLNRNRGYYPMTKSLFVLLLACAGAANADIWHSGDVLTYTQSRWGGDPGIDSGATLLVASFDALYGAAGGVIVGSATEPSGSGTGPRCLCAAAKSS